MINFRYHLTTIAAIFFALAIGLGLGSAFLDRTFIDALNTQVNTLESRVKDKGEEVKGLKAEAEHTDRQDEALVNGALAKAMSVDLRKRSVVIVADDGTDEIAVRNLVSALTADGASVPAVLYLTDQFDLDSTESLADLAAAIGGFDPTQDLSASAVTARIGDALMNAASSSTGGAAPSTTTAPTPGGVPSPTTVSTPASAGASNGSAVVDRLVKEGFVHAFDDTGQGLSKVRFEGENRLVFATGTGRTADPEQGLLPLSSYVASEADESVVVVAVRHPKSHADLDADIEKNRADMVAAFRDAEGLDDAAAVIDNGEQPAGMVSVVLALAGTDVVGDFGVASSADRVVPDVDG